MRIAAYTTLALLVHAAFAGEPVTERTSTAADRSATAITVYNDNLALIKEKRRVELARGLNRLSLREVAGKLQPETALLRAVSGPSFGLIEQNFDFDLLSPQKMLEKYVGRDVSVIRQNPANGEERREKATVLSSGDGVVLRFADRIETGVPGRLAFDAVPANLRDRPTLSVLVDAEGGKQEVELSYLSGGFSWQSDYVAQLSADGKQLDLNGWVTLTNRSGAGFNDAQLQLVAGTVNRSPRAEKLRMTAAVVRDAHAPAPAAREEGLLDYHLYSFDRPTSIADNQTKQLALLAASSVPVQREYLLAGGDWYYRSTYNGAGQKFKPAVYLSFDNKAPLGKPLPAGVVRVYAKDSKGAAQFVGEDRIEHTARNEVVKLKLGEAFDITAERVQTKFQQLGDRLTESSWKIELRNAKDEPVVVRVQEPMPGDWEVTRESQAHKQDSAHAASWHVAIPAGGKTVLEYTARVKW
ncbi:DUF4139 domain-containing protein [Chitinimonas sp.]|uniref:DUF4139 domain-containing protein n=1 Tax=Chitinimonas sp. TaxID=1934313 RepID=UPI0035B3E6A0